MQLPININICWWRYFNLYMTLCRLCCFSLERVEYISSLYVFNSPFCVEILQPKVSVFSIEQCGQLNFNFNFNFIWTTIIRNNAHDNSNKPSIIFNNKNKNKNVKFWWTYMCVCIYIYKTYNYQNIAKQK